MVLLDLSHREYNQEIWQCCVLISKKLYNTINYNTKFNLGIIDEIELDVIEEDRKSTRLNSSHSQQSRMPSSA